MKRVLPRLSHLVHSVGVAAANGKRVPRCVVYFLTSCRYLHVYMAPPKDISNMGNRVGMYSELRRQASGLQMLSVTKLRDTKDDAKKIRIR